VNEVLTCSVSDLREPVTFLSVVGSLFEVDVKLSAVVELIPA
jgi:hypothetical protein